MISSKQYHAFLLIVVLAFWTWSGIKPHDTRLTWVLETFPFMIALPIMLLTYKRFPLTDLTYTLIAAHAMILMLGGHYSYAKVPLGFWMEDWFGWTRNNYDKIGHFMQGFGPAIYAREIIARTSPLRRGNWLGVMSVALPLAFSALYEIFEAGFTFQPDRYRSLSGNPRLHLGHANRYVLVPDWFGCCARSAYEIAQ